MLPVIAAGQAELVTQRLCPRRRGLARAHARPYAGSRRDLSRLAGRARGHVRRRDALAGAVPASRVDGLARLGPGSGQAHPARLHGALLRHRHADLHRAFPAAVGRPLRRARAMPSASPSTTRPGDAGAHGADADRVAIGRLSTMVMPNGSRTASIDDCIALVGLETTSCLATIADPRSSRASRESNMAGWPINPSFRSLRRCCSAL